MGIRIETVVMPDASEIEEAMRLVDEGAEKNGPPLGFMAQMMILDHRISNVSGCVNVIEAYNRDDHRAQILQALSMGMVAGLIVAALRGAAPVAEPRPPVTEPTATVQPQATAEEERELR